jgi:hypothetical protein
MKKFFEGFEKKAFTSGLMGPGGVSSLVSNNTVSAAANKAKNEASSAPPPPPRIRTGVMGVRG